MNSLHVILSKVKKKVEVRGIPHLAKDERDVGHPMLCGREKDLALNTVTVTTESGSRFALA
jgi:hypothetical protein